MGQLVLKLFSNVERKTGRSRGNWQKETQRYYGIKWSQTQLPSSSNNEHVLAWTDTPSCLPSGFFIISTTFECIAIGHFTELIVNDNGNKIMTEIKLLKEGRWEVIVNGKNIDLLALNLDNKFDLKKKSVNLICDTVQKLKYCDGVPISLMLIMKWI